MPLASPALTGLPALYGADIFTDDSTQKFPLGAIGYGWGGNKVYRYSNNGGTATVAGSLYTAADVTANHVNRAADTARAVDSLLVTFSVGATAAAADLYAEGELVVNDAAGEGISYRVSGNTAYASSGAGTTYLMEAVQVALTTSSEVSLIENNWKDVQVSGTDQGNMAVGVSNKIITADQYGWLQTRGLCSTLADETLAVGSALTIGTGAAGAVEVLDAAGEVQIGIAQQAGVDTEHRLIYLTID